MIAAARSRAPSEGGAPALRMTGITKTFGDFVALDEVDFDLANGEIHALLGENGAGKSTLMNVVAGLYAPDHGDIEVQGTPVRISGPQDARLLGIGMVHQHYKLVGGFTALENIMLFNPRGSFRQSRTAVRTAAADAADKLGFRVDLDARMDRLSVPEQQRVEIMKILIAGASIIILDEPTAVLTDAEAQKFFAAMRGLAEIGNSVVLVTHRLSEALSYADRITVMRGGRRIRTVHPEEVDADTLTELIVGTRIVEKPAPSEHVGAPVLTVSGLELTDAGGVVRLRGVTLDLHAGEIYCLAGIGGNGQTELVEALTGLVPPDAGRIDLAGHGTVTGLPPDRLRRLGLACIPSDRQGQALAGDLTVAENFAIGGVLAGRFGGALAVRRKPMAEAAAAAVRDFEVMGVRSARQKAGLLSGGNAQKLVIAREFSGAPSVIVAHSPSRGLDVRAAAAVHGHLRAARDRKAAVLLISEDLDEVLLLADRIGVMRSGRIVAEFPGGTDRRTIGRAMVGHD